MKHKANQIFSIICLFLFICIFSITTLAQEKSLDDLSAADLVSLDLEDLLNIEVTTASKKAEKTTDAPGIISTITAEEIKYFGANSLEDVLERATSIQSVGSHLFPNNVSVMRGDLRTHYDNHMLILINGRPIREGVMGGLNSPIYTAFPVDMIEKIEIVRGPGSVLYGSNAFVGVINILTKKDDKSSFRVKANAGSFGTINGTLTGSYVQKDFNAKVSFNLENINGWDFETWTVHPAPTNPDALLSKKYAHKNLGIATDINYKGLSLTGFYAKNTHDIVGILPYITYAGNNKYDRLFLDLGYKLQLSEKWEANVNLTHSGTKLSLDDEALVPVDKHTATDYLAEISFGGELVENLNLVLGGVLDSRNKSKSDIGPTDAIKEPYNLTQISSYLQADYRPINNLKLIAGAQLNKPENQDADIVPRIGAIFNFTSEFGIKTLYGQAFRSPWPVEQYLINPVVVGNTELEPEKIATLDVQLFYTSKKAEASITYYNSKYTNSITRQPLPNNPGVVTYVNLGELHMNGFEFEGKASVTPEIFLVGSATLQNNADEETVPVYIPSFMGKIGAFINLNKNLKVGVFNTFFGKPKENSGATLNPEAKAVDLLSINLNYKLPISLPLELNLYVQNLLNSEYNYTEFGRSWVNTLPIAPGTAIYAGFGLSL